MKKIILILTTFILVVSCQGVKEAGKVLRNEKTNTTDEFLVKKRKPLVLPPDYNKIPEPGSLSEESENNNEEEIKKILKVEENENSSKNNNSSIEKSILDKIRK